MMDKLTLFQLYYKHKSFTSSRAYPYLLTKRQEREERLRGDRAGWVGLDKQNRIWPD